MPTSVFIFVQCPVCGKQTPAGAFCAECGAKLCKKTEHRVVVKCSECGRSVAEGKFCAACGKKLPEMQRKNGTDYIRELVKMDYFKFTEQEKNVLLFFLSQSKIEKDTYFSFEASLSDVYLLLEIFDEDFERAKECLDAIFRHASVKVTDEKGTVAFNWIKSIRVNATQNTAWLEVQKEFLGKLKEIYQENKK